MRKKNAAAPEKQFKEIGLGALVDSKLIINFAAVGIGETMMNLKAPTPILCKVCNKESAPGIKTSHHLLLIMVRCRSDNSEAADRRYIYPVHMSQLFSNQDSHP